MIDQTEALLSELHHSFAQPMREHLISEQSANPFGMGSVLREPIFYGGESAYDFQYLDFSPQKYAADNAWLKANKGFSIDEASEVVRNVIEIYKLKMLSYLENLKDMHPDSRTLLSAFIFTQNELKNRLNIDSQIIMNVLSAFCIPIGNRNEGFTALNEFNITNACPLIPLDNDQYLLFQHYNLAEALYESPFYWMNGDTKYLNKASDNRGVFVENFSLKKLVNVFGPKKVFLNLDIYDPERPKERERGEIDVLVVFGNRAIILQAKSKRLTLAARRGNDNVIQKDFRDSIQDAYNQGFICAKLLSNEKYILVDSNSNPIKIQRKFSEIYIFCVIPDHYPALTFQSRQFLKWEQVDNIQPPFIMDIFCLDVMTEMLQSPLYLLSYVNRRTLYIDKIIAHHEITILSFFMKNNPWLEDNEFASFDDSVSRDIDSAMIVRRLGIPGNPNPDGVLSHLARGRLGKILRMIEQSDEPVTIDLGFLLLTLGSETISKIEQGLEKILEKSTQDQSSSDLSIAIGKKQTGLTIHSNKRPIPEAMAQLRGHCEMRKYIEKAQSWYGLCVFPDDGSLRFVVKGEYPWVHSDNMDNLVKSNLTKRKNKKKLAAQKNKVRVNDPCPCGSTMKFKKCCR